MTPLALSGGQRRTQDLQLLVGLLVAMFLLVAGGNLAGNGVLASNGGVMPAALPGWERGSLLQVLATWVAGWLGFAMDRQTGLLLVYTGVATLAAIGIYRFLRASDWPVLSALLALALVAGHGVLLFSVTETGPELFYVLAAALLIPARRRLESVGDVQSIINYGLTLPLMLMAGPAFAALIPLLVLAVPLREPEARQKPQVFMALLLVAIVPVLIIMVGVWAMASRAGLSLDVLVTPFAEAFRGKASDMVAPLVLLAAMAPVGVVMAAHSLIPDRRRQVLTSALALFLPLYLLVGNAWLDWGLAPWTPAAVMLATTMSWLCATRIRPWMRWLVLALLLAGCVASWLLAGAWADPAWLDGLMPIQMFGYSLG